MAKAKPAIPGGEEKQERDGRRRRSLDSRARIVDALRHLVSEGNVSPGAARVAEMAGVSLRTVFRHFEDVDSLYREIAESVQARVLPAFFRPYRSSDWKGSLRELLERRIELYEAILPFKIAGDLRRFHSEYLARDYREHLKLEKTSIETLLPAEVKANNVLFQALRAATSFQTWRMLRCDQGLPVEDARSVLEHGVDALLASLAAPALPSPVN